MWSLGVDLDITSIHEVPVACMFWMVCRREQMMSWSRDAFFLVLMHGVRECDVSPVWGENISGYEENKWCERKGSFLFIFPVSYMCGITLSHLIIHKVFAAHIGLRD